MLIKCGEFNLKILLQFIYPIAKNIRTIFTNNYIEKNASYKLFVNALGFSIGGIIYLIIKINSTSKKINNNTSNNQENDDNNIIIDPNKLIKIKRDSSELCEININNIYNENNKKRINPLIRQAQEIKRKKEIKKYLFIFLLSFMDSFTILFQSFAKYYLNKNINFFRESLNIFFGILFFIIFSAFILGHKLYEHQILSIIIMSICFISIFIVDLINDFNETISTLFQIIICVIIINCIYSLYNVIGKWYLEKYMDSPYRVMFIIGIYELIICGLIEPITFFIPDDKNETGHVNEIYYFFKNNINILGWKFLPIFLGDIIFTFIWLAGIYLTLYYLTPNHFSISESFNTFISVIILLIEDRYNKKDKTIFNIVFFTLYPIIILFSLVYNEIIIFNFWKFNKNTKEEIKNRQLNEYLKLMEDEKLIDDYSSDSNNSDN